MRLKIVIAPLVAGVFVVSGTARTGAQQTPSPPMTDAQIIAKAMSAAPQPVAQGATIVAMGKDSSMRTVRSGTNGFTCMLGPDPMCLDANAMEWAHAWMTHGTPPNKVGFMYMLAGDTGASNTDPYATAQAAGNHWIQTGPHIMIVGPLVANNPGYQTSTDPDVTKPYVMWGGTPYAHLMIPMQR